MSRYEFSTEGHTIVVGWDGALETYFAQVWKGKPESAENVHPAFPDADPQPRLWVGGNRNEVRTVEELARHLKPYAALPPHIEQSLRQDLAQATPPTPHQRFLGDLTARLAEINAAPRDRGALESAHGRVWDTRELQRDFEVLQFQAPYVVVRRREDVALGSLEFQHHPRLYYSFVRDHEHTPSLEEVWKAPPETIQEVSAQIQDRLEEQGVHSLSIFDMLRALEKEEFSARREPSPPPEPEQKAGAGETPKPKHRPRH